MILDGPTLIAAVILVFFLMLMDNYGIVGRHRSGCNGRYLRINPIQRENSFLKKIYVFFFQANVKDETNAFDHNAGVM